MVLTINKLYRLTKQIRNFIINIILTFLCNKYYPTNNSFTVNTPSAKETNNNMKPK